MKIEEMNMEKVKELAQLEIVIDGLEDALEDTKMELKQKKKARKECVQELIRIGSGQLQIDDYSKTGEVEEAGRDALQEIIQLHVDENEAHLGVLNKILEDESLAGPEDLTCAMARKVIDAMDLQLPDVIIKELCEGDSYSCEHCGDMVEGPGSYYLNVPQDNDDTKYCCKAEAQARGYPDDYEEPEKAEPEEAEEKTDITPVMKTLTTAAASGDPFKLTLETASPGDIKEALLLIFGTSRNKGREAALISKGKEQGWAQDHEDCAGPLIQKIDDLWWCACCGTEVTIKEEENDAEDSQG